MHIQFFLLSILLICFLSGCQDASELPESSKSSNNKSNAATSTESNKSDSTIDNGSVSGGEIHTVILDISDADKQTKPVNILWIINNYNKTHVLTSQNKTAELIKNLNKNHDIDVTVTFVGPVQKNNNNNSNFHLISPLMEHIQGINKPIDLFITRTRSIFSQSFFNTVLLLSKDKLFKDSSVDLSTIGFSNSNELNSTKEKIKKVFNQFLTNSGHESQHLEKIISSGFSGYSNGYKPIFHNENVHYISSLKDYFNSDHTNIIISHITQHRYPSNYKTLSDRFQVESFIKFLDLNYGSHHSFKYYGYTLDRSISPQDLQYNPFNHLAKKLGGRILTKDKGDEETTHDDFFNTLAREIQNTATTSTFTLEHNCKSIEKVVYKNTAVDPSLYSCKNKIFSINAKAITYGKNILVNYYK
ncbi:MAG: hypothetical protein OXC44_05045 [Proteobacteria bacterium]|nr:hypothetical protein [Pseudomonadota bacterium]